MTAREGGRLQMKERKGRKETAEERKLYEERL